MHGSSRTAPVDDDVPDWMDEGAAEGEEGTDADKTDGGEVRTGDGDAAGKKAKKEQTEKEEGDNIDFDGEGAGTICDLYPWEHNELVCRELVNCFGTKTVVHHNTNCSWPLACARHAINFVGFARNEVHAQHVHKTLVAMVVAEIIEGTADGFSVRRFLSTQRSLGGSTVEGGGTSDIKSGASERQSGGGAGTMADGGSAGADGVADHALGEPAVSSSSSSSEPE